MFTSPGEIAFSIGPITVHWYGLVLACAFLIGLFTASKVAKQFGESADNIFDLAFSVVISAIIGARLYYVLLDIPYYSKYPIEIPAVWHGGLSIHGGIIGGFIALYIYIKRKNLSLFKYADILSFGLIAGQSVGRWGNFFNSEAFGRPTNLPWKLFISPEHRPEQFLDFQYFHPTFLYESIWNFLTLLILFWLSNKVKKSGVIFFTYLLIYSIGRFFIEQLRVDSVLNVSGVPIALLVSILVIVIAILGLVIILRKREKLDTNTDLD